MYQTLGFYHCLNIARNLVLFTSKSIYQNLCSHHQSAYIYISEILCLFWVSIITNISQKLMLYIIIMHYQNLFLHHRSDCINISENLISLSLYQNLSSRGYPTYSKFTFTSSLNVYQNMCLHHDIRHTSKSLYITYHIKSWVYVFIYENLYLIR